MRSLIVTFALYLCLSLQNFDFVYGQNFDAENCNLARDSGPCKAYMPMYAYDNETHSCVKFIYGGCQGNVNRFPTEEECKKSCQDGHIEREPVVDICSLTPEPGLCLAYIQRYHYNIQTHKCEQFIYGGCGGNANNFKTIEECEQSCSSQTISPIISKEEVCGLEPKTGLCKGYFPRYYYDSKNKTCEQFIYGGCDGNANNFETIESCHQFCNN